MLFGSSTNLWNHRRELRALVREVTAKRARSSRALWHSWINKDAPCLGSCWKPHTALPAVTPRKLKEWNNRSERAIHSFLQTLFHLYVFSPLHYFDNTLYKDIAKCLHIYSFPKSWPLQKFKTHCRHAMHCKKLVYISHTHLSLNCLYPSPLGLTRKWAGHRTWDF